MTLRPRYFHLVAAIAFLSATPVFADGFGGFYMPLLTFTAETQNPTRAALAELPSCVTTAKKADTCSVEAAKAFAATTKQDK